MSSNVAYRLKEIVDLHALLSYLGFTISIDNTKEFRGPCAIHGGDNRTAFCLRKDTRRFYCFSHGCEKDEDGNTHNDVIDLVMRKMGCSFAEAIQVLADLSGVDLSSFELDDDEIERAALEKKRKRYIKYNNEYGNFLPQLDNGLVSAYCSNGCAYFKNLGFSDKTIQKFELGTMVDHKGVERASIPIYDAEGRLVAISGRRVDGGGEPRYRLTDEFNKRFVLYNLHNVLKLPQEKREPLIIVEGFKVVWYLDSLGYQAVVAVMGKAIVPDQINLLVKSNINNTLLLLDGDESGRLGLDTSHKLMRGKINNTMIELPKNKSPDDLSVAEIHDLLSLFLEE